jgi:hypothetical protein
MVRQMKKLSGFTFVSLCVTLILFQFGVEPVNASPISCSTQIDLGTSSSYSALGASVANTGAATLIHGNLGVSPGAQTGSNVKFISIDSSSPEKMTLESSTVAMSDVQTAFDCANKFTTGNPVLAGDLAGQTLSPGVYTSATAAISLSTSLTLSGHATDTFTIQVGGALSTAATSIIVLDGVLAKNVYWIVKGAVSLGAGSTFKGNIISGGALSLGDRTSLEGRALSLAALNLYNNSIVNPPDTVSNDGPETPLDLGKAGTFAAMGVSIANTGNRTAISGAIGIDPGALSGSDISIPANETLTIVSGDTAAAAITDLQSAFNDAATRKTTSTKALTGDLGGITLSKGVYSSGAAAVSLSGTLKLDGGMGESGTSNSIFILQIGGVLSTAALSRIELTGGAQASHVFWAVGGAVNLGAQSTMEGTIMSEGALSLGDGAVVNGRVLSLAALNLYNNEIIIK